jgi:dTDP-4-amino-4,6-dideoxy-D-galactose acyltransferase
VSFERLDWDSAFFGVPIGRVSGLDGKPLRATVEEADENGIRCLYLLCPVGDLRQLHSALDCGFRPYDVRTELSCGLEDRPSPPQGVREAGESDEEPLLDLARRRMRDTRFWADQRFPRDRVEDLYAEWLRRGLSTAPLRRTFVTGEAEGFVTCQCDAEQGVGRIELIAVAASREGTGLGDALVEAAAHAFAEAGLERAEVVTQAQNVAAQRLYQRNGYRTSKVDVWLHRWAG